MIDTEEKAARHRALTSARLEVHRALRAIHDAHESFTKAAKEFAFAPTPAVASYGAILNDLHIAHEALSDTAGKVENELRNLERLPPSSEGRE